MSTEDVEQVRSEAAEPSPVDTNPAKAALVRKTTDILKARRDQGVTPPYVSGLVAKQIDEEVVNVKKSISPSALMGTREEISKIKPVIHLHPSVEDLLKMDEKHLELYSRWLKTPTGQQAILGESVESGDQPENKNWLEMTYGLKNVIVYNNIELTKLGQEKQANQTRLDADQKALAMKNMYYGLIQEQIKLVQEFSERLAKDRENEAKKQAHKRDEDDKKRKALIEAKTKAETELAGQKARAGGGGSRRATTEDLRSGIEEQAKRDEIKKISEALEKLDKTDKDQKKAIVDSLLGETRADKTMWQRARSWFPF